MQILRYKCIQVHNLSLDIQIETLDMRYKDGILGVLKMVSSGYYLGHWLGLLHCSSLRSKYDADDKI